jgi:hypothetical protein
MNIVEFAAELTEVSRRHGVSLNGLVRLSKCDSSLPNYDVAETIELAHGNHKVTDRCGPFLITA